MTHPTDLLTGYAAGTLPEHQTRQVATHLRGCRTCTGEVAGWRRLAGAVQVRVAATAPPPAAVFDRILSGIPDRRTVPGYQGSSWHRPLARAAGLVATQVRLVGRPVWWVAGLLLLGGLVVAAAAPAPLGGRALSTVVPLLAALAVAGACGAGSDPAGELVAASATSPRTVLLARLTVVLAAVSGVAGVVSVAATVLGDGQPASLLASWLGPMALLSAVAFALAVLWRPEPAVVVAIGLWALRMLAYGVIDPQVGHLVSVLWQTTAPVLVSAVLLVAVTVLLAPLVPARSLPTLSR